MTYLLADNLTSPLGNTTADNLRHVLAGDTCLRTHNADSRHVAEDFVAALFDADEPSSSVDDLSSDTNAFSPHHDKPSSPDDLTPFERRALGSLRSALAESPPLSAHTIFILSTTKGDPAHIGDAHHGPAYTATRLAHAIGITEPPIVVSNACISGLTALTLAHRLLRLGLYDHAVVCGADEASPFTVAGFQSLKALSPTPCRPFDIERNGLNLGEAVASIVLGRTPASDQSWAIADAIGRNDAYHLTQPSRTADGQSLCLQGLMERASQGTTPLTPDDISFINLHGTATLFNDQMEAVALRRAGLSHVPANALKGYFGHTLGAAGLLETIVSLHAADQGYLPGTRGYLQRGVSAPVNLSPKHRPTDSRNFIKTLSGFGGCNAAMLFVKGEQPDNNHRPAPTLGRQTHHVGIRPGLLEIDGKITKLSDNCGDMLTYLYKARIHDYPRFYKMDPLSRLGFVASELLLQAEGKERMVDDDSRAVVVFNHSSSVDADRRHLASIARKDDFFPSPSTFIYTLPNILTGEIALRNHYHGETALYILSERNPLLENRILQASCADTHTQSLMVGFVDHAGDNDFCADLSLYEINTIPHNTSSPWKNS